MFNNQTLSVHMRINMLSLNMYVGVHRQYEDCGLHAQKHANTDTLSN